MLHMGNAPRLHLTSLTSLTLTVRQSKRGSLFICAWSLQTVNDHSSKWAKKCVPVPRHLSSKGGLSIHTLPPHLPFCSAKDPRERGSHRQMLCRWPPSLCHHTWWCVGTDSWMSHLLTVDVERWGRSKGGFLRETVWVLYPDQGVPPKKPPRRSSPICKSKELLFSNVWEW